MEEYAKIWRNEQYQDIELLSATFKKFSFTKHWHDELAIGLIQKGSEGLDFNGSKIYVPQNHIVAINPSEVHTGFAGCERGWTYRMFYFDVNLVQDILKEQNIHHYHFLTNPIIKNPMLFQTLLNLHLSLENENFALTRDSLLVCALSELFMNHSTIKAHIPKKYKDFKVNHLIKEYLIDNAQENIALDELSLLANRDKYQLIRNFKNQYGITPHQFLIQLKIKKSKTFLEEGHSLSESALSSGFFDQSHFGKNFKSMYGITPGTYKRSLKV